MKARSRAKKAKAAKTRAQRPRIDPDKVKRLDDARRERRQKALAKVQGRIGRVAETVSGDLPVTKDAVTLIVGEGVLEGVDVHVMIRGGAQFIDEYETVVASLQAYKQLPLTVVA